MAGNGSDEDFRGMVDRMEREDHLRRITKPIDARHITALSVKAPAAILCENVKDFEAPVAAGLF